MSAIKNIESALRRVQSLAVSETDEGYVCTTRRYSVVQQKSVTANGRGSSALTAIIDSFEVLDQQDRTLAAKKRGTDQ